MPSYCTDFYFSISEFYMVTYVTDCQRQTPNRTHANISCSTQLEIFFLDTMCLQNSLTGSKTFSAISLTMIHCHFGNVYLGFLTKGEIEISLF